MEYGKKIDTYISKIKKQRVVLLDPKEFHKAKGFIPSYHHFLGQIRAVRTELTDWYLSSKENAKYGMLLKQAIVDYLFTYSVIFPSSVKIINAYITNLDKEFYTAKSNEANVIINFGNESEIDYENM